MSKPKILCCLLSVVALAGTADRAAAQSDPSPWRFGVSLGGGALLSVVAEYWSWGLDPSEAEDYRDGYELGHLDARSPGPRL